MNLPAQLDRAYLAARPARALARLATAALLEGRPLTARARWLNPLVFATLAGARALPRLPAVRAPLFLVGSGRTGTTWLGKVLSLHCEVAFLNEPKALWHTALADEDLIGSYGRAPARLWLDERDAGPRVRRALCAGYGALLLLARGRRVLDKYPELVFRVELVRALFPDARFLFLARAGGDACRSVTSWSARHRAEAGGRRHDWWGVDGRKYRVLVEQGASREADLAPVRHELAALGRDEDRAALEWILAMRAGLAAEQRHPAQVLRLRYEELAAAPRPTLARVLAFAGLPADERVLAYAERTAEARSASGALELAAPLRAPFERTLHALGYGSAVPGG